MKPTMKTQPKRLNLSWARWINFLSSRNLKTCYLGSPPTTTVYRAPKLNQLWQLSIPKETEGGQFRSRFPWSRTGSSYCPAATDLTPFALIVVNSAKKLSKWTESCHFRFFSRYAFYWRAGPCHFRNLLVTLKNKPFQADTVQIGAIATFWTSFGLGFAVMNQLTDGYFSH
jgi:hypothetical protein